MSGSKDPVRFTESRRSVGLDIGNHRQGGSCNQEFDGETCDLSSTAVMYGKKDQLAHSRNPHLTADLKGQDCIRTTFVDAEFVQTIYQPRGVGAKSQRH